LTTTTGGFGGFFASVLVCGVTGQQEQQSNVSADEEVLGGGGGSFLSAGGGTKPASSAPLPASTVSTHNVAANKGYAIYFNFFIIRPPTYKCPTNIYSYIILLLLRAFN
jgi:hypothetical protein